MIHLVGKKTVKTNNIVFIKASASYAEVYMNCGEKIVVSRTLKELESKLCSSTFIRTHKSFLVNASHVIGGSMRNSSLKMRNNLIVDISRRKRPMVSDQLKGIKLILQ